MIVELIRNVDLELLRFENNCWLVYLDSIYGYVENRCLVQTDTMKNIVGYYRRLEVEADLVERRKVEEGIGEYYRKLNENEVRQQAMKIKYLYGKIWIGMRCDEAIESLSYPIKRNKTVGEWGVHEQWIYGSGELYLYFENGILKTYQKGF